MDKLIENAKKMKSPSREKTFQNEHEMPFPPASVLTSGKPGKMSVYITGKLCEVLKKSYIFYSDSAAPIKMSKTFYLTQRLKGN